MQLTLIRHGESTTSVTGTHQTFEDPLTEQGKSRLYKLEKHFDCIFSSDMPRAVETAKIMFPGKKIIIDKRLQEKRNGVFEGVLKNEADWSKVNEAPFMKRKAKNGESLEEVVVRVRNFISELPEGNHAIVSHGTVLRVILALVLKTDIEGMLNTLQIGNGSILEVTFEKKSV